MCFILHWDIYVQGVHTGGKISRSTLANLTSLNFSASSFMGASPSLHGWHHAVVKLITIFIIHKNKSRRQEDQIPEQAKKTMWHESNEKRYKRLIGLPGSIALHRFLSSDARRLLSWYCDIAPLNMIFGLPLLVVSSLELPHLPLTINSSFLRIWKRWKLESALFWVSSKGELKQMPEGLDANGVWCFTCD